MALAQVERRHSTSSNGRSSASAEISSFQRELENNERFQELLQAADLANGVGNRDVVLPFLSTHVADENIKSAGDVRRLDTTSPKGAGRGMPLFILAIAVLAGALLLLINLGEYTGIIGALAGFLTASSAYVLYWLTQRNKRRVKDEAQQHRTVDRVFEFSTDKEKRLEERETRLRQEERAFMLGQIELSRQRSHILTHGYMSLEFANDQLIELLRENNIDVPKALLTQTTRAQVLGELKEVEDKQAATIESHHKSTS